MQYFQIQLSQAADQRSKSCRSWRKKSQHTLTENTSSSSTDLLQFRPTSTLTEKDKHTNILPHCSDDILSIKLLLEATKSELQWIRESLLLKNISVELNPRIEDRVTTAVTGMSLQL